MSKQTTSETVAEWMRTEFEREDYYLSQADAAAEIERSSFVSDTDSGGLAIAAAVLGAFRARTPDLVWIVPNARGGVGWTATATGAGAGRSV